MNSDSQIKETLDGYVVDIACLRTIPSSQIIDKAKEHTKQCALMGHCMESGYGLVDTHGNVVLLDAKATPQVVNSLNNSSTEKGIWLHVVREEKEGKMATTSVSQIKQP